VHRRQADRPKQIWQADHTELDVLVLDERGNPARPWLTVVLDDCSRAVCGYTVFLGAPSALNLSLALRQAIRPTADSGWVASGLPEVLYAGPLGVVPGAFSGATQGAVGGFILGFAQGVATYTAGYSMG